ncbi:hypothetical protein MTR_7g076797 [Medicago truncatula]|uniref:Uncharacterized protein n=1 Tax=Medicago truncatula TaxID=3880 RepID=A0A072UC06_MEDTR|nr:hypothetical protein MTR_7g076797 [Medicago truncatula]
MEPGNKGGQTLSNPYTKIKDHQLLPESLRIIPTLVMKFQTMEPKIFHPTKQTCLILHIKHFHPTYDSSLVLMNDPCSFKMKGARAFNLRKTPQPQKDGITIQVLATRDLYRMSF